MFEAHTLDSLYLESDTPDYSPRNRVPANSEEIDLSAIKALTRQPYHRTHSSSLRPLTIWFAAGKRKDRKGRIEATLFTYIEYRDNQGQQRFHSQEEAIRPESTAARLERLLERAATESLNGL